MANLHEISRRMSSIRSTMQITRTMSMISTARVRKALDRAEAASPYKEAITLMLANVAGAGFNPKKQPLLATHKVEKNVLFLVIASDRALQADLTSCLNARLSMRWHVLRLRVCRPR